MYTKFLKVFFFVEKYDFKEVLDTPIIEANDCISNSITKSNYTPAGGVPVGGEMAPSAALEP